MEKDVIIYFDKEADFLEILFEKAEGFFRDTENDNVMEKIGNDGRIVGFSIMNVSKSSAQPLQVHLKAA